jgi:hypothetical protein
MKAVLFIEWSYTVDEGRIIYLLQLHCLWGQYYLFTEATLYMKAVFFYLLNLQCILRAYYLFTAATLYMRAALFIY